MREALVDFNMGALFRGQAEASICLDVCKSRIGCDQLLVKTFSEKASPFTDVVVCFGRLLSIGLGHDVLFFRVGVEDERSTGCRMAK